MEDLLLFLKLGWKSGVCAVWSRPIFSYFPHFVKNFALPFRAKTLAASPFNRVFETVACLFINHWNWFRLIISLFFYCSRPMVLGMFGKCCSKSWKNPNLLFCQVCKPVSRLRSCRHTPADNSRHAFCSSFYLAHSIWAKSGIFYASEY